MINQSKVMGTPGWSKNEYNRWADYIELNCLISGDDLFAKADLLDRFTDDEQEVELLSRGEAPHSRKYDILSEHIDDYYRVLEYREETLGEIYPFYLDGKDCLVLKEKLNEKQTNYFFLLMCASIYYVDKHSEGILTSLFEKYSVCIMKGLVCPGSETVLFGTAREEGLFKGTLRARIEQLAKLLGATTTKQMDEEDRFDRSRGGDGGVDIISFLPIDKASHIPFAFAQCTCSYDNWVAKQASIGEDVWGNLIRPLAPYMRYMFVPFSCHNTSGAFEEVTNIHTCLIDRIRILAIVSVHPEINGEIKHLELEKTMSEIWDEVGSE